MSNRTRRWHCGNGCYVIRNVSGKRKKVSWRIRFKQYRKEKERHTGEIIEESEKKMRWSEETIPYCENKEQAIEYLRFRAQEEVDKMLGKYEPKITPISFNEFAEEYIEEYAKLHKRSWERDVKRIERFKRFFTEKRKPNIMLTEINTRLVEQFKSWKFRSSDRKEKLQPQTVNKDLSVLSRILKVAVKREYLRKDDLPEIERLKENENLQQRILKPKEERRLLQYAPRYLRDIILFAVNTGARKSEILTLKWKQVDLKGRTVEFVHTKNGKSRVVPLNESTLEVLRNRQRSHENKEYVFTNPKTRTRYKRIKKAFSTVRAKADLEDLRFHDLRHTCATRLIHAGVSIYTVSKILGHLDIGTTMRYLHEDEEKKREAVKTLDNLAREGQNRVRSSSYVM